MTSNVLACQFAMSARRLTGGWGERRNDMKEDRSSSAISVAWSVPSLSTGIPDDH